MWKKLIEQITFYNLVSYSVPEYCENFVLLLNEEFPNKKIYQIYSQEETESFLHHNNGDLFTLHTNIREAFNNGEVNYIISLIYHYFNLGLGKGDYSQLFNEDYHEFIYSKYNFEPDILLSHDDSQAQATYLFLYFLPCVSKNMLLFHYRYKIPLISCSIITNDNFDMLFYLMRWYEPNEFLLLTRGYNLNLLLLENFIEKTPKFYDVLPQDDFANFLPMYKIYKLLDVGCGFKNFFELRERKKLYTFPYLPEKLLFLEKQYAYNKLDAQLTTKKTKHILVKI